MLETPESKKLRPLKSWFTISFWKSIFIWLFLKPKYVYLYLFGIGLVYFIAVISEPITDEPMRTFGFLLNLIGIITTYCGIFKTRKIFNLPGFREIIKKWIAQTPIFSKHVRVSGIASTSTVGEVKVRAYRKISNDAPIEERVKALEKNMEYQDIYIKEIEEKIDSNIKDMKKEMNFNIENIQRNIGDINNKLMQVTVGDTGVQFLGLAWIVTAQAILLGVSLQ